MTTLLAFDTSTEYCSVALLVNGQRYERSERLGNGHSDRLLPWIDELTHEAAIRTSEIDGILFGAGPGSFTGLRIACGVAQGLAYGLDKKVIGVSTLAALGYHFKDKASRIAVVNDARMNECYVAIYETRDGVFAEIEVAQLISPDRIGDWCAAHDVGFVVGTAVGVYEMNLTIEAEFAAPDATFMIQWAQGVDVSELWVDAEHAAPLYVRNRVALTIDERRQGERL